MEGIKEVLSGGAPPITSSIAKRVLTYFSQHTTKTSNDAFDLSKREMAILTELVSGLSYKLIAAKLFIPVFTVNNHIQKIYQKMHLYRASEAVVTAIQKNRI